MQWKKFLIPPVAIYAVIFLLISAFIGATIDQTAVWIVALVITIVGLVWATRSAKPSTKQEVLKYGVAWLVAVVAAIIIGIFFTPFQTCTISNWVEPDRQTCTCHGFEQDEGWLDAHITKCIGIPTNYTCKITTEYGKFNQSLSSEVIAEKCP